MPEVALLDREDSKNCGLEGRREDSQPLPQGGTGSVPDSNCISFWVQASQGAVWGGMWLVGNSVYWV